MRDAQPVSPAGRLSISVVNSGRVEEFARATFGRGGDRSLRLHSNRSLGAMPLAPQSPSQPPSESRPADERDCLLWACRNTKSTGPALLRQRGSRGLAVVLPGLQSPYKSKRVEFRISQGPKLEYRVRAYLHALLLSFTLLPVDHRQPLTSQSAAFLAGPPGATRRLARLRRIS